MNISACFTGGGGKTLNYLLAAIFTLAAAQTAKAEWYGFKGSATSPSYWDVQNNWSINTGGTWNKLNGGAASNVHINKNANGSNNPGFTSGWDNTITFRNSTQKLTPTLLFCAGSTSDPIKFVATSAENGLTCSADLHVKSDSYTSAPCLEIQSGTYKFTYFRLGSASGKTCTLVLNGGTLKATSTYSRIGTGGGNGVFTIKSGSFDNLSADNKNLTLGQDSGSSGTLNVEGGTFTVGGYIALNYKDSSVKSTVNITGGTLTANQIYLNYAGTNGGTITIDGGTLKAYADRTDFLPAFSDASKFHVYAGANGATIDTGDHNITIGVVLENKSGEVGTVTFTGGGAVTLSGTPTYTGGTTVDAGTVLKLGSAAKSAIFAHNVKVDVSEAPTDGTEAIEITDGTISSEEFANVSLVNNANDRYALELRDSETKVVIVDKFAGEYVWNGGTTGANWTASGNWTKNSVAGNWYDSTAAVFAGAGDSATVDSDVTAASVTFRENATVDGSATLTPGTVAVSDGVEAVINAPTAGALEKTGPGTLTLGASRTEATTKLSEGKLVMGAGTTLDWSKFALGADAAKSVVLEMDAAATLAIPNPWFIGANEDNGNIVPTTKVYKKGGDWTAPGGVQIGRGESATVGFYNERGTLSVGGTFQIGMHDRGTSALLEISGGTVTNTAGYLYIGVNHSATMNVRTGGKYGVVHSNYGLIVGGSAAGTLNVAGGDVFVGGPLSLSYKGGDATVVVSDNGVLTFNEVKHNTGESGGTAKISLDGGTIRANADSAAFIPAEDGMTVAVKSGGGTIDANGKTITIAEPLLGDEESTGGGMAFKGGGVVTLAAGNTYTGKTTVDVGTTLVVPAAIAGGKLAFTIPSGLATGVYKVMAVSGEGTFAADVLSAAALPDGSNVHFSLENGNTEIWCAYSANASEHVWIGGASGSLNDGANWLSGSVPTSGTAFIGNPAVATLENPEGSAFAATRITIPSGSVAITVSGAAFSGITRVANNSTSVAEFQNAVTFAVNVNVIQNTGAVKFTGGATGVQLGAKTDIHGTYNFTKTGDLTEIANTVVKSDGVYNLPNGTFYKHLADFSVEAGGKAEVGAAKINRNVEARLFDAFNGEFKVNGEFSVSGGNASDYVTHYLANSGTGTLVANRIRVITHGAFVPGGRTIVGGGIIRGNGYIRVTNSGSHEFGSYGDWTFYADNLGNTTDGRAVFYKHDSKTTTTLTFDTTDYYDSTIGRTITGEALIGAYNAGSAAAFRVTVKGKGRFVFANTSEGSTTGTRPTYIFSGGLTVNDSATVEVMPNAWPGKGAVTMNDTSTLLMHTGGAARTGAVTIGGTATLEVAESGTATLGGNLTLQDGATLKFTFTDTANEPVLAIASGKTVSASGTINVSVGGKRPASGATYVLTSSGGKFSGASVSLSADSAKWAKGVEVEDGEIVLSVRKGLCVIVR